MAKQWQRNLIVASFGKNVTFTTMPGKLKAELTQAARHAGVTETVPARFRIRYKKASECQNPAVDLTDPSVPVYEGVLRGTVSEVHTEAVHRGCTGVTLIECRCLGRV